jgi:hypothetical protein
LVDETGTDSGFPDDRDTYSWAPQPGAVRYQVARAEAPDFTSGCVSVITEAPFWRDTTIPAPGTVFHYLNRAWSPFLGSWGWDGFGIERVVDCTDRKAVDQD